MLANPNKTPSVVVKDIAEYLPTKDKFRLAQTSRYLFFSLKDTLDRTYFLPKLIEMIRHAKVGIEKYLALDAAEPWFMQSTSPYANGSGTTFYSKGYQRAVCFKDILSCHRNGIPVRLFSLYTLFKEKNGTRLKARVSAELSTYFGVNFQKIIEEYIRKNLKPETIVQAEKKLLDIIHNPKTGKSYYDDKDFEEGFMSYEIRQLFEIGEEKTSNKRCAIS